MTDATQTFQETLGFLRTVLPGTAPFFCLSSLSADGRWIDQPHRDLLSLTQSGLAQGAVGANCYFALSGFAQGKEHGRFRTGTNASVQRSLWLDVDCDKSSSPYPDADAGLRALTSFIRKVHLPIPTVVSSGHGLHVYWSFVEDGISTEQWRKLAGMLKALCVHFQFTADHSRTMDPASVLRIPNTWNYDYKGRHGGTTTPVKLLTLQKPTPVLKLAGALVKAIRENQIQTAQQTLPGKTTLPVPGVLPPVPSGLHFDMHAFDGEQRHPFRILQGCEQIRTAGLGTYDQWYNMMLVIKHCAFAEKTVHAISATDPARYDRANVQRKYEQAVAGEAGPCRCTTFDAKRPGICGRCPHRGKITTPLQLGEVYTPKRTVKLAAPVVPTESDTATVRVDATPVMEVPAFSNSDFAVVPGKGIYWFKKSKGGEDEAPVVHNFRICDSELYIHSIVLDHTEGSMRRNYLMRRVSPGRAPEDITFSIEQDLSPQGMLKWFGYHGMLPLSPKYNKAMCDFMSTYLAAVQNSLPEVFSRDHFGWTQNVDRKTGRASEGFIVADRMYTKEGITPVALNDRARTLAEPFHAHGQLEVWKHIPKMYRVLDQPFAALMVGSSFAAPFMRYGNGVATNVAFSLWDIRGGKGKSTVLEAAASVWGNPRDILQTKNDTTSSRFQKYAVYQNLPIFVDEITNISDANISDLVYDIVNGREKSRSTSGGTGLAKQGKWDTITLFTSNTSLYEMFRNHRAQSNATHMRLIEMQCDFPDYAGKPEQEYISTVCSTIRRHYGIAGPAFMEYCFKHPEVFDRVRDEADRFAHEYGMASSERFWMYGLGITLAAIRVAVEAGLLDYDVDGWLLPYVTRKLLPRLRGQMNTSMPSSMNYLSDFMNEHLSSTLLVESAERRRDQPDPGAATGMDTYVKSYPVNRMVIRRELDTNTCYVSKAALTTWAKQNHLSMTVILQELRLQNIWRGEIKQLQLGRWVSLLGKSRSLAYVFHMPKEWQ